MKTRIGNTHTAKLLSAVIMVALLGFCFFRYAPEAHASVQLEPAATKYRIAYHLGKGKQAAKQVKFVKTGKMIAVKALKKPTRKGYAFAGWYKNKKLTKKARYVYGAKKKSKRTLYAKWRPKTYKISYNTKGGTLKGSYAKSYKYAKGRKLPTPKRKGYKFLGWYTANNPGKLIMRIPKKATGTKKLYAKWKTVKYSITYVTNGGTIRAANPESYSIKKAVTSLPTPTRTGYSFVSWYADASLKKPVNGISKGTVGNKKFYARWRKRVAQAHRGYHEDVPANSLAAYRAAHEKGFTYVEADVRFTSDGVPVLVHDETIALLALRNDSDNKLKLDVPISYLTYKQLQAVSLAKTATGENGENVTRYEDYLKLCAELNLRPTIDVKDATKEQVAKLVSLARAYGVADSARWASFNYKILTYVRSKAPSAKLSFNMTTITKAKVKKAAALAKKGSVMIGAKYSLLTKSSIKLCKSYRLPLGVWTLSNEKAIAKCDPYINVFSLDGLAAESVPETL